MDQLPTLTDEQQAIVRHEAMMAEVMKLRSPKSPSDKKPWWQQVLESSVIATIITVVGGSIAGSIVVANYQEKQKANEQAIAEYRQYIHKEEEIVEHTYDVLGTAYLNAQQELDLTRVSLQEENYAQDDRKVIRAQRMEMINKINDFRVSWEKERELIGFRLSYYHYGQPDVATAWKNTASALDKLRRCSDEYYGKYLVSKANVSGAETPLCVNEGNEYSLALHGLSDQITAARGYSWQILGIPTKK